MEWDQGRGTTFAEEFAPEKNAGAEALVKFREHRGSYADSMDTVVEIENFDALLEYANKLMKPFALQFKRDEVFVSPYTGRRDPRNGWDTHIVTATGYGVLGFVDGPVSR
jgi:hypothetical protein